MNGEQRIAYAQELAHLLTLLKTTPEYEHEAIQRLIDVLKAEVARASYNNPDAWELIERGAKRLAT